MAKKSRRARRSSQRRRSVRVAEPVQPLVTEVPSQEVDFAEEYHYVLEDLRRIGIIAVVLLMLLIALAILIT
jgi:hypothetical protein